MAQQVEVLSWPSNMQQDRHLESGPEPCEETQQGKDSAFVNLCLGIVTLRIWAIPSAESVEMQACGKCS